MIEIVYKPITPHPKAFHAEPMPEKKPYVPKPREIKKPKGLTYAQSWRTDQLDG